MNLSAPSTVVFLASLVIAVLAILSVLGKFVIAGIPAIWIMAIAYGVLAVGCLFKGA